MIPASVMMKLATLGLSEQQAEAVAGMLSEVEAATSAQAEKGVEKAREKARARWHKWNDKRLQTAANVCQQLAGVEDSSSKEEISGKVKEERTPAAPPRLKATRLSPDWVIPEPWLQEAITAGLSRSQALASAATMRNWSLSDPKGAKLDWLATWRNWFARELKHQQRSGAPPNRRRNYADVAMDNLSGQANGSEGIFGTHSNVERLPARLIESRPDSGDVRSGLGRRFVAGDR